MLRELGDGVGLAHAEPRVRRGVEQLLEDASEMGTARMGRRLEWGLGWEPVRSERQPARPVLCDALADEVRRVKRSVASQPGRACPRPQEHLVQQAAEPPKVCGGAVAAGRELFGREVVDRSAALVARRRHGGGGVPQVEQLEVAVGGEHKGGGAEASAEDAAGGEALSVEVRQGDDDAALRDEREGRRRAWVSPRGSTRGHGSGGLVTVRGGGSRRAVVSHGASGWFTVRRGGPQLADRVENGCRIGEGLAR